MGLCAGQEMEHAELPECMAVDDSIFNEFTWKFALVVITVFWIKVIVRQVYCFCQTWFEEYISKLDLKYDLLTVKLENIHKKIDNLQKSSEGQLEALEELKRRSDVLRSDLDIIRTRVATLQLSGLSAVGTSTSVTGAPPPPPPPPPFSLLTPAVKIVPPTSAKTDLPKKKAPTGPPQFSISQADITKVLQKLKKTSSTARLLGSGSSSQRKTPPRRKLFGRTPGHSRRRSITALSPGVDFTRHKTPLSSISPPAYADADAIGNARNSQK